MTSKSKLSDSALYIRAAITSHAGTNVMRKLKIPTYIVEIPPSVIDLKGYVVAGQVFWHSEGQWNGSRCLMCLLLSNTSLELMLCQEDGLSIPESVEEVYLAPSHIVRRTIPSESIQDLKKQCSRDEMSLPLAINTKPLLSTFLEHKKPKSMEKRITALEEQVNRQRAEIEELRLIRARLESTIKGQESDVRVEEHKRKRQRAVAS